MTTAIVTVAVTVGLAELMLWIAVWRWRPEFQWLITKADEAPEIDRALAEKHAAHGFDGELGWVRKPGTSGADQTSDGLKAFSIDDNGCRRNPGAEQWPSSVAVFGDSYAFCRLVGDDETWPHFLSTMIESNVKNFGVGNYGLDQALLRFERELPQLTAKTVIMAVVPETIVRIHSYWKHYFEYGNILAFKPRFTLDRAGLNLHPTVISRVEDYAGYTGALDRVRQLDPFYRSKFRKDLLVFPLLFRVMWRAKRHALIFWHLAFGRLKGKTDQGWRSAFDVVVEDNARFTDQYLASSGALDLLEALCARFAEECFSNGKEGMVLIIPQPTDLRRKTVEKPGYREMISAIGRHLPVLDATSALTTDTDWPGMYVDGPLGPHLSVRGNRVISGLLAERLAPKTRASA